MPRDLSEVLHYFLPEADSEDPPRASGEGAEPRGAVVAPATAEGSARPPMRASTVLPVVAVPIGDHDVLRAAFTWNLAVEIARLGGRAIVIAPGWDDPSPLWPDAGIGPLGAQLLPTTAADLGALYRVAIDTAIAQAGSARNGGVILVRVPPTWLRSSAEGAALLRWTLLFSSTHRDDLLEAYGIGKLALNAHASADVGVAIHGARSLTEARNAFERLAEVARHHLDRHLLSYGLLVDDLDVYRAIVAQRPIGLVHPQSPAARALADVARLILDDARGRAVA